MVLIVVVVAMFFATKGARFVSDEVRRGIEPPGPPVSRANLARVMGDVPVAPFLVLDEASTNDPALRLQAALALGRGRGESILVFRSAEPFDPAAAWYQQHLQGWTADPSDGSSAHRERERNGTRELRWTRNGDRVALVSLPQHSGELLLFVSTPSPRKRG